MRGSAPLSQETLHVVVPVEELTAYEKVVFAALRRELEIPGFRKGNVPEELARRRISPERTFREAVERAVAEKGSATLDAFGDRVVGEPRVEVTKAEPGNPLEFRMTVELLPDVSLEDWRSLRVPFREPDISDDDVGAALEEIRRSRVKTRAVARPAQRGDLIEVDFTTRVSGIAIEGGSSKNHPIVLGEGRFVPGFEDAIVGVAAGEEKAVTLPFPDDWPKPALAGKEGDFAIFVRNVQERILPDIDDEFARSLGRFADLTSLREHLRNGLLEEAREKERRRVRVEALDRLGERIADAALPEAVIAQELERMREEFRASVEEHGATLEEHLAHIGKREGDLMDDWRGSAIRRAKAAIVLREIARLEGIEVLGSDVEARAQELFVRLRDEGRENGIDFDRVRSYTEHALRNEKTLELIEQVVTSEASESSK